MKKQDRFLKQVSDGKIIFSDAFPYIGKNYYIPKPMIAVQTEDESKQGDSRQKKKFKNLKYISVSTLADFVNGTFPEEHMEDMKYLGLYDMKVSVGIHGMEEPEPFRVWAPHGGIPDFFARTGFGASLYWLPLWQHRIFIIRILFPWKRTTPNTVSSRQTM